jgi:small subunit ribosomal protein S9
MADDPTTPEEPLEDPTAVEESPAGEQAATGSAAGEEAAVEGAPAGESAAGSAAEEAAVEGAPAGESAAGSAAEEAAVEGAPAGEPAVTEPRADEAAEQPAAEKPPAEPAAQEPAGEPDAEGPVEEEEPLEEEEEEPAPRVKPAVPGAHLEVDIVPEGVDPLAREAPEDPYAIETYEEDVAAAEEEAEEEPLPQPISTAAIDLAAGARYRATGKRKTAIARVILRPGSGAYLINGRTLEEHFPRVTLQRNIRQPLETVGYEERMDVVARLHGGGISAQAGALRHGVSRALLEADPNLRGELKRRGFLTRDSRAKERKKAGLKKARKRPQFSKR